MPIPAGTKLGPYEILSQIGDLMYASHHAYGRMGLGAPETDRMVEAIQRLGAATLSTHLRTHAYPSDLYRPVRISVSRD